MKKITDLFRHFEVIAFSIIVVVTLVQVFMRYVISSPLKWAEEFSRYIFVWAIMIGVAIGGLEEGHICLNMVTTRLKPAARLVVFIIGQLIMTAFNLTLIVYGGRLAIQNLSVKSPAMKIPIGIAYGGIPIGAVIVIFFIVLKTCEEVKAYKASKHID